MDLTAAEHPTAEAAHEHAHSSKYHRFLASFCAEVGEDCSNRFFEAFHYDNEASANELADLVLAGVKRATVGLLWSFESAGGSPPKPGDLSVFIY